MDFPEEGIPEPQRDQMLNQVINLEDKFLTLLQNIDEGRKIREGIMIVIAGRPNVGKSSLLNTFLQEERAIVTEIPGTTRDVIEAQIQIRGIPVRLIDTAGIRSTDNLIEKIGIEKAEQYMSDANLILLLLDGSQNLSEEDKLILGKIHGKSAIIVINKTDLPQKLTLDELGPIQNDCPVIKLSLETKNGFSELEKTLIEKVGVGKVSVDDRPLLSRVRHKQAIEKGLAALKNFHSGLENHLSEDLLAVDLRSCLEALGEITGKNVSDEILHGIFAQFCIGK